MPDFPRHVPLAGFTRGGHTECVFYGSIAVTDRDGQVVYQRGDIETPMFTRSTLKPFQAVPFVMDGGPAYYGYTGAQVALLCASHSGETVHAEAVADMLAKAGNDVVALQCGCHVPLRYLDGGAPTGLPVTPLQHNCSGKHAGFLAACQLRGWSREDYLDPSHPLQRRVAEAVSVLCDVDADLMPQGIDGCSAPNWALPLPKLAHGYAKLSGYAPEGPFGEALTQLGRAMLANPHMVSGEKRFDLGLMRTGSDWVAKGGADGLQAIGIGQTGLGVAIKIADGNARALYLVTLALLERLGLLPASTPELAAWRSHAIRNIRGTQTGDWQVWLDD